MSNYSMVKQCARFRSTCSQVEGGHRCDGVLERNLHVKGQGRWIHVSFLPANRTEAEAGEGGCTQIRIPRLHAPSGGSSEFSTLDSCS